jgi:hypothetical protein
MASIQKSIEIKRSAEQAWAALRAVGKAHQLFAPVLADAQVEGDLRTARFANGMVVHERILDIDEKSRRVAYTVVDGPGMSYHHASMQIVETGEGRCTFVWITDFLPPEARPVLAPLIDYGTTSLKANLERR